MGDQRAMNNPDLETEGQVEKIGGRVQKKIGQVEKVPGEQRSGLTTSRMKDAKV